MEIVLEHAANVNTPLHVNVATSLAQREHGTQPCMKQSLPINNPAWAKPGQVLSLSVVHNPTTHGIFCCMSLCHG